MNFPSVQQAVVRAFIVALCLCASGQTSAASADPLRFRPGVRNAPGKRGLNADQRKQVLQSLREKTGWPALAFDDAGFLMCPEPQLTNGGSAAARRLLGAALGGAEAYDLENHNASPAVGFARLAPGTDYVIPPSRARFSVHPVQLDFADFFRLRGDGPARQAFDLGIAVLHELAHGVWQLRDAGQTGSEPGECEAYINQIRRELRLPERQTYQARARLSTLAPSVGTRLIAELRFVSVGDAKPKHYRLQWDAEAVGSLVSAGQATPAGLAASLR